MTNYSSTADPQSTTITKSILTKIERICKSISYKTGVPAQDLYSECISRVPIVIKNYNAKTGKAFEPYLLLSMRGYALNYCRDKSFLSPVGRRNLQLYNKSKKFPNLEIAASCMLVPIEELEYIHATIKNLRSYNSVNVEDEWKLGDIYSSSNVSHLVSTIISDEDFDLVYDIFVNKRNRKDANIEEVLAIINKLLDVKEDLLDALSQS